MILFLLVAWMVVTLGAVVVGLQIVRREQPLMFGAVILVAFFVYFPHL